jgi:23S rRNA (uracil1939-C5)-methyltransferase
MQEDAIAAVASMTPERIVYVSCEPSTLARDILRFEARGYALQAAEAYDLFPRTKHVETVVLMSRNT